MQWLEHERYLAALDADTAALAEAVADGDPEARVPACPDWDLGALVRHTGTVHRWAFHIVDTRATERPGWDDLPDAEAPADAAGLARWFERGSRRLAALLRERGPAEPVWGWAWERHTGFWARRMAQETLVHRIDAEQATGRASAVDADLAADNVDELLHNATARGARAFPNLKALAVTGAEPQEGDGTLHLHCTDTPGEWLLRRTAEGFAYDEGHAKGAAAVRGTARELLLWINRRGPAEVEVLGDTEVARLWSEGLVFD